MTIKGSLRTILERGIRPFGYALIRDEILYEWQKRWEHRDSNLHGDTALPKGAEEYLDTQNPRLREIEQLYAKEDRAVTVPAAWNAEHVSPEDLRYFRGDNAYVYQTREFSEINYAVTALYVESVDSLGLLSKLSEDGEFGAQTLDIRGRRVSRDLLDSILEINFLNRHVGLERNPMSVLDIGAGYGRLAHRVAQAYPQVRYFCTDAVPVSTFLCEYYLRYRGIDDRAKVVPLSNLKFFDGSSIDLAINVHSFSECTPAAIEWWIDWIRERKVEYVFIVPNIPGPLTNAREEMGPILEKGGYRLVVEEAKYPDPVVARYAIYPSWYYLYRLRG